MNRQDGFHARADICLGELGLNFSDTAPASRQVDDESFSVMVTGKRGRKLSGKSGMLPGNHGLFSQPRRKNALAAGKDESMAAQRGCGS